MCSDLHVCLVDAILHAFKFFWTRNLIFCLLFRSWLKFHPVCAFVGELAMCNVHSCKSCKKARAWQSQTLYCVYLNMVHERALIEPATCVEWNWQRYRRQTLRGSERERERPRAKLLSIPHGSWSRINPNKCWTKNNIGRLVNVVYVACSLVGSASIFRILSTSCFKLNLTFHETHLARSCPCLVCVCRLIKYIAFDSDSVWLNVMRCDACCFFANRKCSVTFA